MFRVLQHIFIAIILSAATAGSAHGRDSKLAGMPVSKSDLQILNSGGVLINVEKVIDATGKSAKISSSVKIDARPETIWAVLIDCKRAPTYVPGLKKCEILEMAPDKSWDKRRHTNKPAAFLPTIKSEFRCDYTFPKSISFVSTGGGDMKTNTGVWTLSYDKASGKTLVSYNARIASKTIIPDKMIRKVLKKNVTKVMRALREEVMADKANLAVKAE